MPTRNYQRFWIILTSVSVLLGLITWNVLAALGLNTSVSSNAWSRGGPLVGTVNSLAVAPSSTSTIYAGINSNSPGFGLPSDTGVYKSIDNGLNWTESGLAGKTVYSLEIDPANQNTVYAGTYRNGVHKSTDGGVSWNGPYLTGPFLSDPEVFRLVIDPSNASVLYAGVIGHGLYKSTDSGLTWSSLNIGLSADLAIDPSNTSILYAVGGSGSNAVFKSTNGGDSWNPSGNGIPDSPNRAATIALSLTNNSILYVGIGTEVYKSTDSGANWHPASAGLPGSLITSLAVDPTNASIVLGGTITRGVFKSSDGGGTWNSTYLNTIGVNALVFEVGNSNNIYAGTRGSGVFKSLNGGTNWSQSSTLPYGDARELVIDPINPAIIYANTTDSVYKSSDRGASWLGTGLTGSIDVTAGLPTHKLVINPTDAGTLYVAVDFVGVFKTTDAGATWTAVYLENTNIEALAIDPITPENLYLATYPVNLYKSSDGGTTWNSISAPGDIWVLAIDPANSSIVYAGSDIGVSKSTDGGDSWTLTALRNPTVTNPYVISLVIDSTDASRIYAATINGDAYGSTDGGTNWNPVFTNVAGHVLAFAMDSDTPGGVFVGTEQGVFRSTDGGQTSSDLSSGLPDSAKPVMAFSYDAQGRYLYAGTLEGVFTLPLASPTPTPVSNLSISGRVTDTAGRGISNVTMTFVGDLNPEPVTVPTDENGNYSYNYHADNAYSVNPSKNGYTFSPLSVRFIGLSGNLTANFMAAASSSACSNFQFSATNYSVNEKDGSATISVIRTGNTSGPAAVDYSSSDGSASERSDYTGVSGILLFADGETIKTFTIPIIDDVYVEGNETVNLAINLNGEPTPVPDCVTFTGTTSLTISNDDTAQSTANPMDDARFFVRQHYYDFLDRLPDQGGLDYWTNEITQCGGDQFCVHGRRIGVSAAFFVELEFQQTGSFVYRFYKASYGRRPTYAEFKPDRNMVVAGSNLEASKDSFAYEWVQRAAFLQQYPASMTPEDFVNKLFDTAQLPSDSRRQQLAADMRNGRTRAQVLLDVVEFTDFKAREFNPSFVLMQYFDYLRRDVDQGGYDFWLDVLNNRVPDNFRAMVCAFITSAEYQERFSPVKTRTNADCARL